MSKSLTHHIQLIGHSVVSGGQRDSREFMSVKATKRRLGKDSLYFSSPLFSLFLTLVLELALDCLCPVTNLRLMQLDSLAVVLVGH